MSNPLSALGGNARASASSSSADPQGQGRSGGQDFDKLLGNDGARAAPKPAPRLNANKTQQAAADKKDAAAKRPQSEEDTATEPSRSAQAGAQAARDSQKNGDEAKAPAKAPSKGSKADAKQGEDAEEDAGWPPAGLAGIGMSLLPTLAAALPAASAGPLGAAGLAIGVAGAAAQGVAALLGGDTLAAAAGAETAAGAAATAAAPATAAASTGASAAGGFGGMLAQVAGAAAQAASGGDAAAPVAALAALASATDKSADSGSDVASTGTDPINLLATAGIHAPARSADPAAPFTGSPTPTPNLHGDHFDDELGARMSWLADQKIGHAHIKLSPADLGPVEVRLHLNGDQVNASFSSAQPEVRQALENSLPRLREMLGQHGFQLGQADVGQQQQQASQNARQGGGSNGGNAGGGTGDELLGSVGIPSVVLRQRGLLDAYA
ncbi:flagellar hook-length control protein FliK [Xanthomonas translucens]|uniref:flagellar hook-length control protein FliK n=1 Tax=Xanthomonas campestris pv. translucens TaxID=343 RepID=UPI000642130A|nr:flagellar hook-length control protein FliK [Xanthomonas translucens]MCT8272227.1 flagellar hook-length control protein FliK [Xanthomonas translucens pv. undulosa]MCT8283298.1 flagellar hook-length control protein FliK [Xanthomonas translucens pv. undulosa]MCT8318389.1 flagellar hook-length control protein FliK [Xanthomonas translucens pv. undulosa]QSQ40302.1 flagellar hook-length control protein FliK [Xanthomonas translucens pv. translucens]QSQ48500.1 flagellar hook-length control protein F